MKISGVFPTNTPAKQVVQHIKLPAINGFFSVIYSKSGFLTKTVVVTLSFFLKYIFFKSIFKTSMLRKNIGKLPLF